MKIEITNLTETEINIPSTGGVVTLPPGVVNQVVFDTDQKDTYDVGYYMFKKGCQEVYTLMDAGKIHLAIDEHPHTSYMLRCIVNTLNNKIFANTNIPFEPTEYNKMYFSLEENQLRVINPINQKMYAVQLTELTL